MQRNFIYEGGSVLRYHIVDTIKSQDVAAHSFGVAWWCEILTVKTASKALIMAALSHDLAEQFTGDIPSPAKRAMDISSRVAEYEQNHLKEASVYSYMEDLQSGEEFILKLADLLDGMMYCLRERKLGNSNVRIVYARFNSYIHETLEKFEASEAASPWKYSVEIARQHLQEITEEWRSIK